MEYSCWKERRRCSAFSRPTYFTPKSLTTREKVTSRVWCFQRDGVRGTGVGVGDGSRPANNLPLGDMVTLGGGAAVGVGDGSGPANNVSDGDNITLGGDTLVAGRGSACLVCGIFKRMRQEIGGFVKVGFGILGALLALVQESKILASCFKAMSCESQRLKMVQMGRDLLGLGPIMWLHEWQHQLGILTAW